MFDFLIESFVNLQQAPSFTETIIHLIPIMLGVFVIFYFLVIAPTAKEENRRRELIENLKKGDTIVLTSGICCKFVQHEESFSVVEIAPNVRIKIEKNAISKVL